jgi:hypothetical protein
VAQYIEAIAAARKSRSTSVERTATWDNLVLDDALMDRLKLICNLLREPEKWRSHGVSIPKSLLLVGA